MASVYDPVEMPPHLRETNELFLGRLGQGYYDFIDLGTCDGGGFEVARRQGGHRGLGFDLSPHYVDLSLGKGLDVACLDVRSLRMSEPCVDFAVCSHILEHLPNIFDVGSVLNALSKICRDYILICGPCFEEEQYLYDHNVKLLHSAMTDHTCKFKVIDFVGVLHALRLRDYTIALTERIRATSNHWVHSADEPVGPMGLWTYDQDKHRPKPDVTFDRDVFRDFVCVVPLRSGIDSQQILDRFLWGYEKIAFRSSWAF